MGVDALDNFGGGEIKPNSNLNYIHVQLEFKINKMEIFILLCIFYSIQFPWEVTSKTYDFFKAKLVCIVS